MHKMCYNWRCETSLVVSDSRIFNPVGVAVQLATSRIFSDSRTPVLWLNPLSTFAHSVALPDSFRKPSEVDSGFSFSEVWMKRRNPTYRSKTTWAEMVSIYGRLCAYCLEEPAQSIDHVIPWSYSYDNSIENLRPCCMWCNLHAGDKLFASFDEKQRYLRGKRDNGRSKASRTICTTCFLPYQRPYMTTSLFECPECDPRKSKNQQITEWKKFLVLMRSVGIRPDLHAEIRERSRDGVSAKNLKVQLGQLYIDFALGVDSDEMTVEDVSLICASF